MVLSAGALVISGAYYYGLQASRHQRSRQRLKKSNQAVRSERKALRRSLKDTTKRLCSENTALRSERDSLLVEREEVLVNSHGLLDNLLYERSRFSELENLYDVLSVDYTTLIDSHNSLDSLVATHQRKKHSLQMQLLRLHGSHTKLESQLEVTKKKVPSWVSKRGGAFPPEMRELCRLMARARCSREQIGSVIGSVAKMFGVELARVPSRRSITRFEVEGGVAADIQMGYELQEAKCMHRQSIT